MYRQSQFILAIQSLRPGVQPLIDFTASDIGNGPFISSWLRADITQPSALEIQSVDTDALIEINAIASTKPEMVAAAFKINIAANDIASIDGSYNIVGGAYIDIGIYLLFFSEAQVDANYFAAFSPCAPVVKMTDHNEYYLTVEVLDGIDGNHIDVDTISIQVYRV